MPLQSLLGKKIYRALVAEVWGGEHQRPGGPKRKGIKAKGTPSRGVHPGGPQLRELSRGESRLGYSGVLFYTSKLRFFKHRSTYQTPLNCSRSWTKAQSIALFKK